MYRIFRTSLIASAITMLVSPIATQAADDDGSADSFRLSSGISYSKGDYGELEDTEVIAVPISATYKRGGLKIRVSVPWVHVNGPGSLISTPEGRDAGIGDGGGQGRGRGRGGDSGNSGSGSSGSGASGGGNSGSGSSSNEIEVEDEDEDEILDDDDIVDGGGIASPDNSRSGFGDVNVSAVYSFDLGSGLYFEPGVKVKIPTASRRKRLGTGEVDVTAMADIVKTAGAATFYIHGRRKFAGKPEGSTIRSTWGAGAGASVRAGRGFVVGADYDWQQSAFAGRQASSEVTGWAYSRLSKDVGLTVYASTGFNANSADFAGGASISVRF